jgi:hypothetical protein
VYRFFKRDWNEFAVLANHRRLDSVLALVTQKFGLAQCAAVPDFDYFVVLNR